MCIRDRVAGVAEIVVVTPPGRDGRVPPVILAAAEAVGLTTVSYTHLTLPTSDLV